MGEVMTWAQRKAYWAEQKKRILSICPNASDSAGIYLYYREENGVKYAYVGQAKKVLTRLVQHMCGYEQWIDLSIKKHKLYSADNKTGWQIHIVCYCPESELDTREQEAIKRALDSGAQMRNVTAGGQGDGKTYIHENNGGKTYRQGVAYGIEKAQKELARALVYFSFSLNDGAYNKNGSVKALAIKAETLINEIISGKMLADRPSEDE